VLDTFQGLPVHALVLHFTVVLVPLMALVTAGVAFVARLRERFGWWVVAADVALLVLTFVTKQSGESLQHRLPDNAAIREHAQLGNSMLLFVLGLVVVSVIIALTRRSGGGVSTAVAVLAVVVAVANVVWIVRVGHSGSSAVWKEIIANTTARAGGDG
jgi:uncharacterized membrane protein